MRRILLMLILVFVLTGCTKCPECICPECEPETVTKFVEQEVVKYVCADGSIKNSAAECETIVQKEPVAEESAEVIEEKPTIELMTGDEDSIYVKDVIVKPTCVMSTLGFAVYYEAGQVADVDIMIKEYDKEYTTLTSETNKYNSWNYYIICEERECPRYSKYDTLEKGKYYVLKIDFTMPSGEYKSNEYLIDTTEGSEYMSQRC